MSSDRDAFSDVAATLARELADDAIWFEGRCNWLGEPLLSPTAAAGRAIRSALGSTLYHGTSGVAVFLAEAAVRFDEAPLRRAAVGAIRHALRHLDDVGPRAIDGLHEGLVGIAWAAAHVGRRLDDDAVLDGARGVLARWRQASRGQDCDLMAGRAGALAGLLAVTGLLDDEWLVTAATDLGDELVERAAVSPAGWSWPSRAVGRHDLCGFAHGAAGVGHALLELYALTGTAAARRAAEGAFAYERSWLERRGSWPDLRGVDAPVAAGVAPPASASWCSGTGGIALARARALEVLDDDAIGADAHTALEHVRAAAAQLPETSARDFSLCHGAAGIGDVLLSTGHRGLAADVGRLGIERHHGSPTGFPCGGRGGRSPGLLLGLAGIGLYYLRLVDDSVPTPLLLRCGRPIDLRAVAG